LGWQRGGTQYLLCDGHGSTRQLVDGSLTVIDAYNYDGYGVMLGSTGSAAANAKTSMLYTGEQDDKSLDQYYLRARYYNQSNGTFNRIDPYSGNLQDPQSLHKYLYCHNNPVNAIDPTGKLIGPIGDLLGSLVTHSLLFSLNYGPRIAALTWTTVKLTAAMLMATIFVLILQELGVMPKNEYVAEIAAILGYVLIAELFVFALLPSSWKNPDISQNLRGINDPRIRKREAMVDCTP
jgi:RHS repeat-associated protein